MAEGENSRFKADLLETVLDVIHGQRGQNINELVSLLALSNLLGIISFLNTQDIKFESRNSQSKSSTSELKEMAATLLSSMGAAGDKKINPATLINLMKTLSAAESSGNTARNSDNKADEKKKD
ncbi:MAG TPA: hypothetical protein GX514_03350 [Thermoanaerobacterales bacterium]|uniref:hypothetical protein n=1 Tax=Tepidanaerobacter sp. GT38 TaxID=2722793 RepID=UPI0018187DD3|nr:hypothetical protein [Tepidanaerobacter sp. GT38]MCG1012777.1 hypothetical protein [Tepidanaerobacter sp. GT38]HHY41869.1 hypothetical protein [Thermoanaerobacterales bacterium]